MRKQQQPETTQKKVIADEIPEGLISNEVDIMKENFHIHDKQNQGFINRHDLRSLLEDCGESPSDEKMNQIMRMIEESAVRRIDINVSLKAWCFLKELVQKEEEDSVDYDILNTFVAMGGNPDKTGCVQKSTIVNIVKNVFGLTVDIEGMFEEAGLEIEEDLNFYEFTCLLESGGTQRASRICSIFSVA